MSSHGELRIEGATLPVTNLEKVFYPSNGFTKGDVLDYYIRVSKFLLPHLLGRPITLKRYPDGARGFFFYEKQCPAHRPDWVKTTKVEKSAGGSVCYCLLNDLKSLVWAANLANLEIHSFLHKASSPTRPTVVAFDLDPGSPADINDCCRVGLLLHEIFEGHGLKCFAKTSGSKGLQVYLPLNKSATYERTKSFARAVAERLAREHPNLVVSRMKKDLRPGKVLVDWSQNDDHKTTVTVYSLRAKDHPTVSTPVSWEEVAATAEKGLVKPLNFEANDVITRLEKRGDLFAPVLTLKQKLPNLE